MIFHFLHFSYIKSLVSNMAYKGMIYQSALVRDARKGCVSLVKIIPFLQETADIGRNGVSSIPVRSTRLFRCLLPGADPDECHTGQEESQVEQLGLEVAFLEEKDCAGERDDYRTAAHKRYDRNEGVGIVQ